MAYPQQTQAADDWTQLPSNRGDDVPFGEEEDLYFAETVAPADADQTVQGQQGFSEIPPGTHELVITGRLGGFKEMMFNTTVKDPRTGVERAIGYVTNKVTLKIGLASNPKASMLFDIIMPPSSGNPDHTLAYWHGVPKGKKAQGWHAHTFRLLVDKAIAPWPQGQPMPAAARSFRNWVGRRFIGTVDPPEPYQDGKTGETKMGSPNLNARSFRPAPNQTPLNGLARTAPAQGAPAARPAPQQRPAAQPAAAQPASASAPAANPGGWDM